MKTPAKSCTVSSKEISISKGLVISSFREFIASEGKKPASRAPSSYAFLDILIGNESLKLLWKHRMRSMLKCIAKEIQENRKKQWPWLKRAREEGKIAYFSRKEQEKLLIKGRFVSS